MPQLPYYCPEVGGDAENGTITIRGPFGETKRRTCTLWRNHECNNCAVEPDKCNESEEPRELHD